MRKISLSNGCHKINLIGVQHVHIRKNYYHRVFNFLSRQPLVWYEKVKIKDRENLKVNYTAKILNTINGLYFQMEWYNGFINKKNWHRVDKEYLAKELYEFMPEFTFEQYQLIKKHDFIKNILRFCIKHIVYLYPILKRFYRVNTLEIIESRNHFVIEKWLREKPNNLTIIYGDGHMNHLKSQFIKLGFKEI